MHVLNGFFYTLQEFMLQNNNLLQHLQNNYYNWYTILISTHDVTLRYDAWHAF